MTHATLSSHGIISCPPDLSDSRDNMCFSFEGLKGKIFQQKLVATWCSDNSDHKTTKTHKIDQYLVIGFQFWFYFHPINDFEDNFGPSHTTIIRLVMDRDYSGGEFPLIRGEKSVKNWQRYFYLMLIGIWSDNWSRHHQDTEGDDRGGRKGLKTL